MASSSSSSAPNVDLFDAYFRRADLDRDGRISGVEAVSFFQGSGLPKKVLAQVRIHLFLSFLIHSFIHSHYSVVVMYQSK